MHPFLAAVAPQVSDMASDTTTHTTASVTTSATAYNNITPVQLVASTARDAHWIWLKTTVATGGAGLRSGYLVEVMAGGAGSEYVIAGPVSMGYRGATGAFMLPVFIPEGTRLSVRVRATRTSFACNFTYWLGYLGNNRDNVGWPTRWVAYGMNDDTSANGQGTIVAPGNATWGSWTSLTTSTTYAHDLWMPMVDCGTATTITALTTRTRWAIASTADAATMATNTTVWHGPWIVTNTSEQMGPADVSGSATAPVLQGGFGGNWGIFYAPRAAGAAVSVSARCSAAPDTNALGCSILAAI